MLTLQYETSEGDTKYERIANAVCDAVTQGQVGEGERLPTEAALAKSLGVNRLTVSRAYQHLQELGIVTQRRRHGTHVATNATRQISRRHFRAIDRLAFVSGVKSLAAGRQEYLFLWDDIFEGIRDVLEESDTMITFAEAFTLRDLDPEAFDAVILLHPKAIDKALIAEVGVSSKPIVSLWEQRVATTIPHVDYDRGRSAALASRHLLSCGYRRLGFIGQTAVGHRFQVPPKFGMFCDLLLEAGLDLQAADIQDANWEPGRAYAAMRRLLDNDTLPEAIFVDTDYKAMEVIGALSDAGLSVPDDIGIMAYDDNPQASRYELSTIQVPRRQMGRQVAKLLLEWPQDGTIPDDVILEPELLSRRTTQIINKDAE